LGACGGEVEWGGEGYFADEGLGGIVEHGEDFLNDAVVFFVFVDVELDDGFLPDADFGDAVFIHVEFGEDGLGVSDGSDDIASSDEVAVLFVSFEDFAGLEGFDFVVVCIE
jgi:hypothetical protein